jgi:hypothetical protein
LVAGGRSGAVVEARPDPMAAAIAAICGDRGRRQRLAAGAAAWVAEHADPAAARRRLQRALADTFPRIRPWLP